MKTIKFLLVSLFVMLGTTAFAQGVVVHKTDGTIERIHEVDSVVYEVSSIGYYSFKAQSKAEISSLTEQDFMKLDGTPLEVPCGVRGYPCVLTKTVTAPVMTLSWGTGWYSPQTMKKTEGTSIGISKLVIRGEEYVVWYLGNPTSEGMKKAKIEIKM